MDKQRYGARFLRTSVNEINEGKTKPEGNSLRTIIKDHTLRKAVESIGAWEHVSFRSIGALGTCSKEHV